MYHNSLLAHIFAILEVRISVEHAPNPLNGFTSPPPSPLPLPLSKKQQRTTCLNPCTLLGFKQTPSPCHRNHNSQVTIDSAGKKPITIVEQWGKGNPSLFCCSSPSPFTYAYYYKPQVKEWSLIEQKLNSED